MSAYNFGYICTKQLAATSSTIYDYYNISMYIYTIYTYYYIICNTLNGCHVAAVGISQRAALSRRCLRQCAVCTSVQIFCRIATPSFSSKMKMECEINAVF